MEWAILNCGRAFPLHGDVMGNSQWNSEMSKNGNSHLIESLAQYSIDKHDAPSNESSDISIIPQPQISAVQKEIPVEHNVSSLSYRNSICDNDDTNIQFQSSQINPDVRHHDLFASNVMVPLTSDNPNDDKITNSIEPVCPGHGTQNPVSLGDAICDAHGTDDTNISSVTPDVIGIVTVVDTHHDDNIDMNSVLPGMNEMQSEAYHVGFDIRKLVEYTVYSIVDHPVEESFVECHGEDLAVFDHDNGSIVDHSGELSNDVDHHHKYSGGFCVKFEISNDVRRHTKKHLENYKATCGNFRTCFADINILWNQIGDCDLLKGLHNLFSDSASDFGNLCGHQIDVNSVTLVLILSSTCLLRWQAVNGGVRLSVVLV